MVENTESFDPYLQWLEIPVEDQPPTHYCLLGIDDFESDPQVIDQAARTRAAYLHQLAAGPNREAVQKLLNEVARARRTLMDDAARDEYDDQLRQPIPPPQPAFQIATEDSPARATTTASRSRRGKRKSKSWLNDWRVHGVSIGVLLFGAIGTVLYLHSRPSREAVQPMDLDSSSRARTASSPRRNKSRSLISPERREFLERAAGVNTPSPRATPAEQVSTPKQSEPKQSDTKTNLSADQSGAADINPGAVTLPENWLEGLDVIADFAKPLEDVFDVRGAAVTKLKDKRLVLVGKKGNENSTVLIARGVKLRSGDAVAIETNLRPANNASHVGLIIGPLRIRLTSERKDLKLMAFQQELLAFTPPTDKTVHLMLARDASESSSFRWLIKAGQENWSGRIEYSGEVGDAEPVRVMLGSTKPNPKPSVWLDNLRAGKLRQAPAFGDSSIEFVSPPAASGQ